MDRTKIDEIRGGYMLLKSGMDAAIRGGLYSIAGACFGGLAALEAAIGLLEPQPAPPAATEPPSAATAQE